MIDFSQLFPRDLYHSYVLEGNPDEIVYLLREYLEECGHVNKNSGDVIVNLYDSFAVLDSQKIKEWHQNKPIEGKKKICIIGTKFINHDAEQTLLKIIEEPTDETHFFIVTPDSSLLLGTILSRVHLIKNIQNNNIQDDKAALEFVNMTPSNRIEKIASIIKDFKDSENSGGLRYKAISLINGIERIIYKKWKADVNDKNNKFILSELKNSRDFLSTPGASVKMILEHIALVL